MPTTTNKEKILEFAKQNESFSSKDIVKEVFKSKITRQYTARLLKELTEEGKLNKTGSTKNTKYKSTQNSLNTTLQNDNLEEHKVFQEIEQKLPTLTTIPEHVHSIFIYAFSEMLNNAIEHSESPKIDVKIDLNQQKNTLKFAIRDYGIGVFRSIISKTDSETELQAIQELLKGKLTTAPKAHSGEGIFFTSKVGELFILNSFDYQLKIDNETDDIFTLKLSQEEEVEGTEVVFELNLDHKGHLNDVFKAFTSDPKKLAFDTTEVRISLYTMGTIYISRSQARRVLNRLENFKKVILDFDKVLTVGQAFADEIFRVFKSAHPEIEIVSENMNKEVEFMVERAQNSDR